MALTSEKTIKLISRSMIDGVVVESYTAEINSSNPEDIRFGNVIVDKALYKTHRTECRKDEAEHEDAAYALQDQMIAEMTDVKE